MRPKTLLLGVTYKANIADQRESPARVVAAILRSKGATLSFHDPHVRVWDTGEDCLTRVDDLAVAVQGADAVILLQNHREYNVDELSKRSMLFFDTRGVSTSASAIRL